MTNQTHKVSTDALDTLGTIIDANAGRDAIHLAVEPVVAGQMLYPGDDIGINEQGLAGKWIGKNTHTVGIVDPFLKEPVKKGERFWLVVYPRTITSLRHVWSHPAFREELPSRVNIDERVKLITSEQWLIEFTETHDCPDYETLMGFLRDGRNIYHADEDRGFVWGADSLQFNGIDAHADIPPEFWDHVSVVLGKPVPQKKRVKHFSCSC